MKKIGRKTGKILAAAAAALCLSIAAVPSPARADALIEDFWLTMYDVDYYVVVDAPDGGVNLRYGAGTEYPIQLDDLIPNGTILHIDAEARAKDSELMFKESEQVFLKLVLNICHTLTGCN